MARFMMLAALSAYSLLVAGNSAAAMEAMQLLGGEVGADNYCGPSAPGYNVTNCPGATCCKYPWANNGYGCCPYGENAVCCSNGYTCCPEGTTCQDSGTGWSVVTTCVASDKAPAPGMQVCKNGPAEPFSTTKKNCLIMGDSVSIGYTPFVAAGVADLCDMQHSPWSGDGGACETAYGLQCLDYFMSSPSGVALKPDFLMVNFGIHDMVINGTGVPGQSGNTTVYLPQLTEIMNKLKMMSPTTKLTFAITSPEMCSTEMDDIIVDLNKQAKQLMDSLNIPTVDLHAAIVGKCGPVPQSTCFGERNCFCPHCPPGYEWLANSTIIPFIREQLSEL